MPSSPSLKASLEKYPQRSLVKITCFLVSILLCVSYLWLIRDEGLARDVFRSHIQDDEHDQQRPTETASHIQNVSDGTRRQYYSDNLPGDFNTTAVKSRISATVVLPVTLPTVAGLRRTILDISLAFSSPSDLILVATPALQVTIRDIVRLVLLSEDGLDHLDISIYTWPTELEEPLAVLSAARTVSSDWLAILNSPGLSQLDDDHKAILSSDSLPRIPIPVGVVGEGFEDGESTCVESTEVPRPVEFLYPPFLTPTSLVPSLDLIGGPSSNVWKALGAYVSSTRSDGMGGILAGLRQTPGLSLCASQVVGLHDGLDPPTNQSKPSGEQEDADDSIEPTNSSDTAAFIAPTLQELRSLYPTICRLQEANYSVHALIGAQDPDVQDDNSTPSHHLESSFCSINISVVPESLSVDDASLMLLEWFDEVPSLDAVISPNRPHTLLTAFNLVLNEHPHKTKLNLRIPPEDLPYSDWIGTLSLIELQHWHKPQVEIVVITHDRAKSLSRLLRSLSAAKYYGDRINIRINMEQTVDEETLRVVQSFDWKHGAVSVGRRVVHGGLLPAIVESWYPLTNDSYGLILEDDVEVSPLFYAWIKMSLLRYRYGHPTNKKSTIFGISLYQQKNLELRPEGRHRFVARSTFSLASLHSVNTPYLSQIPCSWGAVYFPEHWRQFHDYLTVRLSGKYPPLSLDSIVAPGLRSNKWTKSWKKYFIEMAFLRGYLMLYPNYEGYVSLSTNHLEVGSHVKDVPPEVYAQKQKLFRHPLMRLPSSQPGVPISSGLLQLPSGTLPPWDSLPVLDLLGMRSTEDILVQRGQRRIREMFGCYSSPKDQDPRKWLCFEQ